MEDPGKRPPQIGLRESFQNPRPRSSPIPVPTQDGSRPRLPPPQLPAFSQQKSASCGSIPMSNRPKPLPPPPSLSKKHRKRRSFTATLRKSAHISLVELRRAYKPQPVLYIIYNISQAQALRYNKDRGLKATEINWRYVRTLLPNWTSKDEIWAVGTNGVEYLCVKREKFKDPVFGLQKSHMSDEVRLQFDITQYTTYYYEELLRTPIKTLSPEGWLVTKHPGTGAILDVT